MTSKFREALMDETRIVGDLPNVRIELTHRAADDGSAEFLTVNLTATPNFRTALPLFGQGFPTVFAAWQAAAEALMAPWLALARANPFLALPRSAEDETKK